MKLTDLVLIPRVAIGPIRYGDAASSLLSIEGFEEIEPDPDYVIDSWYMNDELDVDVFFDDDTGKIARIVCGKALFFNNVNLIGLTLEDAETLLQHKHEDAEFGIEMYEKGDLRDVYYLDELGVTFWVKDGVIESVTADNDENDD